MTISQSTVSFVFMFCVHFFEHILLGVRHACDQGDGLDSYTWTEYDPREGGVQVIKDRKNNVQITTEFLKISGGEHGGSWAARIKGAPMNLRTCIFSQLDIPLETKCQAQVVPSRVSVIFYLGLEGLGGLEMETDEEEHVR